MGIFLNYYSFGYLGGFYNCKERGGRVKTKLTYADLFYCGKALGYDGVELPVDYLSVECELGVMLDEIETTAKKLKMSYVIAIENFEPEKIRSIVKLNPVYSTSVIRIKMPQRSPTIWGGARYLFDDFESEFRAFDDSVGLAVEYINGTRFSLAIENHQDLTSTELKALCEKHPNGKVGITWDIGNSIATGEIPYNFMLSAKELIKHVHLKDYKVLHHDEGLLLRRCVLGEGFKDFVSTVKGLIDSGFSGVLSLELGARVDRLVPMYNDHYWLALGRVSSPGREDFLGWVEANWTCGESGSYHNSDVSALELKEIIRSTVNLREAIEKF